MHGAEPELAAWPLQLPRKPWLDSVEKFHLFWKSFRTKSIFGHVSGQVPGQNLLPNKTWNISR